MTRQSETQVQNTSAERGVLPAGAGQKPLICEATCRRCSPARAEPWRGTVLHGLGRAICLEVELHQQTLRVRRSPS